MSNRVIPKTIIEEIKEVISQYEEGLIPLQEALNKILYLIPTKKI